MVVDRVDGCDGEEFDEHLWRVALTLSFGDLLRQLLQHHRVLLEFVALHLK